MGKSVLPKRVRLLVLGGGIHGVGVLHDLASRGWTDVHLVEKNSLGNGTSSKSTKLIHGGLRYLQRISQFGMVSESLRERAFLLQVVPDLVKPLELILPVEPGHSLDSLTVRIGLTLYDVLSGSHRVAKHKVITAQQAQEKNRVLAVEKFAKFFSFWDAQVDDLALVRRVGASAVSLGAGITENCSVRSLKKEENGWLAELELANGERHFMSALYVVNCLGPWANLFLEKSQLPVSVRAVNNKGAHILLDDLGLKAGIFLRSPIDGRSMFILPWFGYTLMGTTEQIFTEDPSLVAPNEQDIDYILKSCNYYLKSAITKQDIKATFAGLRWLADMSKTSLSTISRESTLSELNSERGMLMTIYGGKLTSYRSLAEKIGDRITKHFGEFRETRTNDKAAWPAIKDSKSVPGILERFQTGFKPGML